MAICGSDAIPGCSCAEYFDDLQHPRFVLVALNLRDRHAFDMYRVDLETGAVTLEATNPGDVLTWTTDNDFVIRAATAFDGKIAASIVRVLDAADKPWRDLVVMPFERALFCRRSLHRLAHRGIRSGREEFGGLFRAPPGQRPAR